MEGDRFSAGLLQSRFFKILLKPRLDLQIFEIPKEFMKTHGDVLPNVIYLHIPTGKKWQFNLVRENGKAFLQKGWPEFVEFYSLFHGHCLMFKYRGDSRFDVVIFDMSASEIDYPPFGPETCRENPPKRRKTFDLTKLSTSKKGKEGIQTIVNDKLIIAKGSRLSPEENKSVQAYADQCENPLFAIKMQPSFVEHHYSVTIPNEYVEKYLDKERLFNHEFNLQTVDTGKTWPVKMVADKKNVKLRSGWKCFVLYNKLKVDDVCLFELINKHEFRVRVFVFGGVKDMGKAEANEAKGAPTKEQTSMDNKVILARGCSFTIEEIKRVRAYASQCKKSKHPLFVTKMQPSFVEYHFTLSIPKEFEKKYLHTKNGHLIGWKFSLKTNTGRKIWPVTISNTCNQTRLKAGWKTFAIDNKLKVDDICAFELINKQEFQVGILRVGNAKENRRESDN
ncbi:B3 domain-containing transcription factor VRN1-like [Spinacia oleracea]|uniref:B3 domain-containing transcription factor VRN1-like n=1 Tax=Spinacia oleracea TaxID=3562 RepID=A0ABM3RJP7_SPIOL|nr:B3 domain-containing transcription factor VRN1-like [Spinacia oleracea]